MGSSFIEFFGLVGKSDYDARIREKRDLAEKCGIDLIEVYPKDMVTWGATQEWLAARLGFDVETRERQVLPTQPQVCQGTLGLPCGRTVDLLVGGQLISLSAVG